MDQLIDFSQPSLWLAAGAIIFNPTFWNIVSISEYHNKTLTKLAGGNSLYACYGLAITIFTLGIVRDTIYERALRQQPTHELLLSPLSQGLAVGLFLSGTYLGDRFGFLMDSIVTGFPFNVTSSPMYTGSSLSFLGTALWFGKPAGVALSVLVYLAYQVALSFEDPFTARIYAQRDQEPKGGKMQPKGGQIQPKGGKIGPKPE